MKIVLRIFLYLFCVLTAIIALAFTFIEGRLLFSGDWLVYDNPASGFVRYLFRLLIALFALATAIAQFFIRAKTSKTVKDIFFVAQIALVVAASIICFFATNYVGIVCLGLSVPALLFKIPLWVMDQKQDNH